MKKGILRTAALLLCLLLPAGCGKVAAPAAETPAPTPTAAPTAAVTAAPTAAPTAQPTAAPTPEPAPEPTPEPTPERTYLQELPRELGGSAWWLYAYASEGGYEDAIGNGEEMWVTFSDEDSSASVYARTDGGLWDRSLLLPCWRDEAGQVCFEAERGGVTVVYTVTVAADYEMELSAAWEDPDGSPGGSTLWFNRLRSGVNGRELDAEEMQEWVPDFGPRDWGFFRCLYAYPQEIDWETVCAGGAGISREPTAEELQAWTDYAGEGAEADDVGVFSVAALRALAEDKTRSDYAEAQEPVIWTCWPTEDTFIFPLDADAARAPEILTAYQAGAGLTLLFTLPEDPTGTEYMADVALSDGSWTFERVYPADDTAPICMAEIRFFETKEEAREATGAGAFISTEHLDSDEPNWVWAVVRSREDGLEYSLDRAGMDSDKAEAMEAVMGVKIPDQELCSGVLDAGETIALEVNLAWYPRLRLSLSKDWYWGEYWFGQENWNPSLDIGATRYVTGHDLDGEHRGCWPMDDGELRAVLADGPWIWQGVLANDGAVACLEFDFEESLIYLPEAEGASTGYIICDDGYYTMDVSVRFEVGEYWTGIVRFTPHQDEWADWSFLPEDYQDFLGEYRITLDQFPGMQLLTLDLDSERGGALGLLLPGAEEANYCFYFYRYQGTTPYKPVG